MRLSTSSSRLSGLMMKMLQWWQQGDDEAMKSYQKRKNQMELVGEYDFVSKTLYANLCELKSN